MIFQPRVRKHVPLDKCQHARQALRIQSAVRLKPRTGENPLGGLLNRPHLEFPSPCLPGDHGLRWRWYQPLERGYQGPAPQPKYQAVLEHTPFRWVWIWSQEFLWVGWVEGSSCRTTLPPPFNNYVPSLLLNACKIVLVVSCQNLQA